MRAAWYERRGSARDVLVVGEMADPEPGPGEVRIALRASGISPGDMKKRSGWPDSPPPPPEFPRIIPHSDGAGVIDRVGSEVPAGRLGQAVWCYGAQSYRPFGTAAEYVVVPQGLAVELPGALAGNPSEGFLEQAACLGIAGITGYRSVFADGSVAGLSVLVYGATGGVGSIATQMAVRDGARVIAVVRSEDQVGRAMAMGAGVVLLESRTDLAAAIRGAAPGGVDRVSEVDLARHAEVNAQVLAVGGVIGSFATSQPLTTIPYWPLGFADATLRLLGSDDFPAAVKAAAAAELTAAVGEGRLTSVITHRLGLEDIVSAHELVEAGTGGRVIIVFDGR